MGGLALALLTAVPAQAHTHPTPVERAAPAVVFVEARALVDVALIEHRPVGDPSGVHIGIIQSTWNPVLSAASGFVVDPTGAIVAPGRLAQVNLDRARVFAVNQAFHQQYGSAAPLPADPFSKQTIGPPGDRTEERLEACYNPGSTNDAGGCVVRATWDYRVFPYVTSQKQYGNLQAEVLPGSNADVAVLRVRGGTSMPTVDLGQSTAGAKAVDVIGFTAPPDAKHPLSRTQAHLSAVGASTLKTQGLAPDEAADNARLIPAVSAGVLGGPVVAERGQVVGFLVPGSTPTTIPTLVTAQTIRAALTAAKVAPHRGPVDANFEAAMHLFKNRGFAASIPSFGKAIELFPGHYLANQNIAIARKQSNGNAAAPASQGTAAVTSTTDRRGLFIGLALGLVLLGAVIVGAWLVLRRRGRAGPAVAAGTAEGQPGAPPDAPSQAGVGPQPGARPQPGAPARPSAPAGTRPQPGTPPGASAAAARGASGSAAPPRTPPQPASRASGPVAAPQGGSSAPAAPGRPGTAGPGASAAPSAPVAPPAVAAPPNSSRPLSPAGATPPAPGGRARVATPPVAAPARPAAAAPAPVAGPDPLRPAPLAPAAGGAPAGAAGAARAAGAAARREPGQDAQVTGGGVRSRSFCTSCGARLSPEHRFCGWCGEAVT